MITFFVAAESGDDSDEDVVTSYVNDDSHSVALQPEGGGGGGTDDNGSRLNGSHLVGQATQTDFLLDNDSQPQYSGSKIANVLSELKQTSPQHKNNILGKYLIFFPILRKISSTVFLIVV